jgi:hypothetical protein
MLEDDIEVSPHFLTWANAGRAMCEKDPTCIGVSLYVVHPLPCAHFSLLLFHLLYTFTFFPCALNHRARRIQLSLESVCALQPASPRVFTASVLF